MANEVETKRHPFRFMFRLLVLAGILYFAGKTIIGKKNEYYGITESEARAKFEAKLGPRIGEDRAAEVADQVVHRLKERGVVKSDPVEEAVSDATEAAEDVLEDASDEAEDIGDEAKDQAEGTDDEVDDA